jgi:hypothetical protein
MLSQGTSEGNSGGKHSCVLFVQDIVYPSNLEQLESDVEYVQESRIQVYSG